MKLSKQLLKELMKTVRYEIEFADPLFPKIWQLGLTGIKTLARARYLVRAAESGAIGSFSKGAKFRIAKLVGDKHKIVR